MEDIKKPQMWVEIDSAYESLIDNIYIQKIIQHADYVNLIMVSDLFSIIDDQNNTIEALKEEIQALKNPSEKEEYDADKMHDEMMIERNS